MIESKNSQGEICVFEVSGKLFCNGCKGILSSKKSILKKHLASKKHAAGKEKLKVTKKRDHVRTCVFASLKTVRLVGRWTNVH